MPRTNRRGSNRGQNNNPSGRNQYSSGGVTDLVRERPVAAAAVAAGAAAAGLFLWSRRSQISEQIGNLSDQIGARNDLGAHRAHQLHRPRVDARHRRDLVSRRILHRDAPRAAQDAAELAIAHAPGRVRGHGARDSVEGVRFDRVDELLRLSARGNEAVPAAAADASRVEAEYPVRDGVRAAEIEEQPSVELLLLQGSLDPRELIGWQTRHRRGAHGSGRQR